jgi:hypothetical protein
VPVTPWHALRHADPEQEYLVLLSFLPLRRFRDLPAFVRHDARITRQLGDARGLIGYSKLARPWVTRFWTLSAWENEAALASFVQAGPHLRAMTELVPRMGPTRFVRWTLRGSGLPPTWNDALRRWAAV